MRRLGLLFGTLLAVVGPASAAQAADECAGLMVCIPVAGPWVVMPAASDSAQPSARWQLKCPQGAVGGTDARISDRSVDVTFPGRVGSPVGPGVTTTDAVLFNGRYVGPGRRAVSFRPFIGCIPAVGGGQRIPTSAKVADPVASAAAALRPGAPVSLRTKTIAVRPGQLARGSLRCPAGERMLGATAAVGLATSDAPSPDQARAITVVRVVRSGRMLVSARRQGALAESIAARVQLQAECAR